MKAYSMDLRKRVLAMCDAGHGTTQVARLLHVSPAWIRRLKQRRREDGQIAPRPSGGRRHRCLNDAHRQQLRSWLEQRADSTLAQLQAKLAKHCKVHCSLMAVSRAARSMGWSFKKRRFEPANRIAPMSLNSD
jgi:transposase